MVNEQYLFSYTDGELFGANDNCLYEYLYVNGVWQECNSNNECNSYTINSKTYYCRYNSEPYCPNDACPDVNDCQSKIQAEWEWVEESKLGTEMTDKEHSRRLGSSYSV